jgi:type IX secretion system PorP/SprF family membrane protein
MKTTINIKTIICQAVLVVISFGVYAQDIHLSQYDASPIMLNPALTGMKKDIKYRLVNQYRNQWDALTGKSYMSSALAFDKPLKEKWGAGAYILNDNSSRTVNSFSFVLSGAHDITPANQDKHHLCVGLQAGIIYKSLRRTNFTFDQQYTQGTFDNDLPSGESFESAKRLMPEINFGFGYYNTDESSDYNPYGGIAISHCTNPKENFLTEGEASHLPLKYALYGGSKIIINEKIALDPNLLLMKQRNSWEVNLGTRGYYSMEGSEFNLFGGLNYRWKDAVIGQIGLFYKNFIYSVSYDLNVSKLHTYSNYKGGLEFYVTFFKKIGGTSRLIGS